ncbi:hypothetical protein NEF87_002448 [Candidatus Lokiarchaeum ossiferum]|uniref:DUF3795 domain-containing protein n=1 Tax=Candidatus Lokiarchaeum ossiferum TaxID=2951803 RepID=A0ABY6HRM4_9ARCH|nr:hypothetical protein NEF87_002448 [Candidatus Lokiarchaeum sp. B-35]
MQTQKYEKVDIAYCGLNCKDCKSKFQDIRETAQLLQEKMEAVNFAEMAKVIPFMKRKYKGYLKSMEFFKGECPGCRNKGGNPFCGIRKCATKRSYFTCAECDLEYPCKKFNMLFRVHIDNEIQVSIENIRNVGINQHIASLNPIL